MEDEYVKIIKSFINESDNAEDVLGVIVGATKVRQYPEIDFEKQLQDIEKQLQDIMEGKVKVSSTIRRLSSPYTLIDYDMGFQPINDIMEKKKLILEMLKEDGALAYITVNTPEREGSQSINIPVADAIKLLTPTKRVVKKGK